MIVVTFKQIRFRDEAAALKGTELFVTRDQLPDDELEEDEFFVEDLIGMTVVTEQYAVFGTVQDVPNYGAGDLVEVKLEGSNKTELYSFEMAVFPTIDFEQRRIVILPPGELVAQPDSKDEER